ncbi:MAG: hypothetical protein ACRDA5_10610 [Clostridium sp.]
MKFILLLLYLSNMDELIREKYGTGMLIYIVNFKVYRYVDDLEDDEIEF